MPNSEDVLVSVCLPTRNGGARLKTVVESIRAQDHLNVEIVISDNASTDDTEDICRDLAAADERIVYIRQRENIGLVNNFTAAMRHSRGAYFRWVSDDDWLAPQCLSLCLERFLADPRLVLVSMGVQFLHQGMSVRTAEYTPGPLGSDDPVARLTEMLRLLNSSYLLIDPLYGLMRRAAVLPIPRRSMLREDQIFACKLALAGPWAHVQQALGRRGYTDESRRVLARRLGVPAWTAHAATTLQLRELLGYVRAAPGLTPRQRREAGAAVMRWYAKRQRLDITRRVRRAAAVLSSGSPRRG